jgi:site-specific DNA-methyltransferase (adenine-specific)
MTSGYYGASVNTHPHGGTPDKLMNEIVEEFGEVFDPCPNGFIIDGLSIDWPLDKVAFVNPPYTRGELSKWVEKCFEQYCRGVDIILLIPSYTDTKYFHEYILHNATLRFIRGRLKFKHYNGKAASFPSMLCLFGVGI